MGEPNDLALVLAHPRFFRIERIHGGHSKDCPESPFVDEYGLKVCWHWQVGLALRLGQVDWFDGFTLEESVANAAKVVREAPSE